MSERQDPRAPGHDEDGADAPATDVLTPPTGTPLPPKTPFPAQAALPQQVGFPQQAGPPSTEDVVAGPPPGASAPIPLVPLPAPSHPATRRVGGLDHVPQPRTAGQPVPPAHPRTRRLRAAAVVAAVALVAAGGAGWAVQQDRVAQARAEQEAQDRVAAASLGAQVDASAARTGALTAGAAVLVAQREQLTAAADRAAQTGQDALDGSPHASDALRGALDDAVAGAQEAADAAVVSPVALRAAAAAVAVPTRRVTVAEQEWQKAEQERIAAEQAAAAAAAAAARASAGTGRSAAGWSAPASTGSSSGAAAPAAAPAAPVVGAEASAGSVGAALNAYRAGLGLSALSIVRSGARVDHARQMAASNSIWHSGAAPEIVGRILPLSYSGMINAYANSPSHDAVMRGSYSVAYIGAVSHDGWLYTSITFG
ncbi:hypothetical protein [Cellulomonas oligotrophica]|uniref:Uncharacterized protein n=1 Tax=Cellulomonas oligotrophica TaxID=931536 RepID=A0A7Y9JZZ1_9CELL|nr:hypothetical protein [Cellulomonas oligotrophica]NYD87319.1 hypothetical protein [Cellulomonas oligotrophica]GIG34238.1 hypothetical protein Col01nite_33970 [Cellulomonas oligotrophica]